MYTLSNKLNNWQVKLNIICDVVIIEKFTIGINNNVKNSETTTGQTNIISIAPTKFGFEITTSVQSNYKDNAYKIALLVIGKMLDVLSLSTNSFYLITTDNVTLNKNALSSHVKIILAKEDFINAFENAEKYNSEEPQFLLALNWFRKGKISDDPYDKFLAFWNSISLVAGKYHKEDERTKKGIKNQIWNCFISVWGQSSDWEFINGDDKWIDDNNIIRDKIAHGLIPIEFEHIENVLSRLEILEKVSYKFLTDFWKKIVTEKQAKTRRRLLIS